MAAQAAKFSAVADDAALNGSDGSESSVSLTAGDEWLTKEETVKLIKDMVGHIANMAGRESRRMPDETAAVRDEVCHLEAKILELEAEVDEVKVLKHEVVQKHAELKGWL